MAYAAKTGVGVEKTQIEIRSILSKHKATSFALFEEAGTASIMFRMNERVVRFTLALPDRSDAAFTEYKRGYATYARTETAALDLWEQACRSKWRALLLVIKAKLEAVAAGITTVEDEFLAATILSDGKSVGETVRPMIDDNYRLGGAPQLRLQGPPS